LGFKSLGMRDLYAELFRPISFDMLMKKAYKVMARYEALNNKYESRRLACQSRSKSIPNNATIRKEYVKCKKPNCYYEQHGPYYYAFWKDPETKRLKKKYIGRQYIPIDDQKKQKEKRNHALEGLLN
jgi:hypothetical protein